MSLINFRFRKIIAAVILLLFTESNIGFSSPVQTSPLFNLSLPQTFGKVKETFFSDGKNPCVYIINTAHTNYDSACKVRDILLWLNENSGLKTVYAEGASAKLRPELLRFFDQSPLNERLADILARRGELAGVEWASLRDIEADKRGRFKAVGIENAGLYREAYQLLKEMFSNKAEIDQRLSEIRKSFFDSSKKEAEFFRAWELFQNGKQDFAVTAKYLNLNSFDPHFPQIMRLVYLTQADKKFNQIAFQKEKIRFASDFKNEIEATDFLNRFESDQSDFSRGYFETLILKLYSKGFHSDRYPNICYLAAQRIYSKEINAEALWSELKQQFENKAQLNPERIKFKRIILLEKLLHLQMSRKEWEEWKSISEKNIVGSGLSSWVKKAARFYQLAEEREQAFLAKLQVASTESSAFVVGGFHEDGLKRLLRKKNIGFVVISPSFDGELSPRLYQEVMLRTNHLEKAFILQPAAASLGMGWDLSRERVVVEQVFQNVAAASSMRKEQTDQVWVQSAYAADRLNQLPAGIQKPARKKWLRNLWLLPLMLSAGCGAFIRNEPPPPQQLIARPTPVAQNSPSPIAPLSSASTSSVPEARRSVVPVLDNPLLDTSDVYILSRGGVDVRPGDAFLKSGITSTELLDRSKPDSSLLLTERIKAILDLAYTNDPDAVKDLTRIFVGYTSHAYPLNRLGSDSFQDKYFEGLRQQNAALRPYAAWAVGQLVRRLGDSIPEIDRTEAARWLLRSAEEFPDDSLVLFSVLQSLDRIIRPGDLWAQDIAITSFLSSSKLTLLNLQGISRPFKSLIIKMISDSLSHFVQFSSEKDRISNNAKGHISRLIEQEIVAGHHHLVSDIILPIARVMLGEPAVENIYDEVLSRLGISRVSPERVSFPLASFLNENASFLERLEKDQMQIRNEIWLIVNGNMNEYTRYLNRNDSRSLAAKRLGELKGSESLPILWEVLEDDANNLDNLQAITWAIGQFSLDRNALFQSSVDARLEKLKKIAVGETTSWTVRANIIKILIASGNSAAHQIVLECFSSWLGQDTIDWDLKLRLLSEMLIFGDQTQNSEQAQIIALNTANRWLENPNVPSAVIERLSEKVSRFYTSDAVVARSHQTLLQIYQKQVTNPALSWQLKLRWLSKIKELTLRSNLIKNQAEQIILDQFSVWLRDSSIPWEVRLNIWGELKNSVTGEIPGESDTDAALRQTLEQLRSAADSNPNRQRAENILIQTAGGWLLDSNLPKSNRQPIVSIVLTVRFSVQNQNQSWRFLSEAYARWAQDESLTWADRQKNFSDLSKLVELMPQNADVRAAVLRRILESASTFMSNSSAPQEIKIDSVRIAGKIAAKSNLDPEAEKILMRGVEFLESSQIHFENSEQLRRYFEMRSALLDSFALMSKENPDYDAMLLKQKFNECLARGFDTLEPILLDAMVIVDRSWTIQRMASIGLEVRTANDEARRGFRINGHSRFDSDSIIGVVNQLAIKYLKAVKTVDANPENPVGDIDVQAWNRLKESVLESSNPNRFSSLFNINPSIRASTAKIIGLNGDINALPWLLRAAEDSNSTVRTHVAWALAQFVSPENVSVNYQDPRFNALHKLTEDKSSAITRAYAAIALGSSKDSRAVGVIQELLSEQDMLVVVSALKAAQESKNPLLFDPILELLSKKSSPALWQMEFEGKFPVDPYFPIHPIWNEGVKALYAISDAHPDHPEIQQPLLRRIYEKHEDRGYHKLLIDLAQGVHYQKLGWKAWVAWLMWFGFIAGGFLCIYYHKKISEYLNRSHNHNHDHANGAEEHNLDPKIVKAMLVTSGIACLQYAIAVYYSSTSMMGDSVHMFYDVGSWLFVVIAAWFSTWRPAIFSAKRHHGQTFPVVFASFLNGALLICFSLKVFWESGNEFIFLKPILAGPVLILISLTGLAANVYAFFVMRSSSESNIGMEGVYLHVIEDLLHSVALIIGFLAVYFGGIHFMDPLLGFGFSIFMIIRGSMYTWKVAKDLWAPFKNGNGHHHPAENHNHENDHGHHVHSANDDHHTSDSDIQQPSGSSLGIDYDRRDAIKLGFAGLISFLAGCVAPPRAPENVIPRSSARFPQSVVNIGYNDLWFYVAGHDEVEMARIASLVRRAEEDKLSGFWDVDVQMGLVNGKPVVVAGAKHTIPNIGRAGAYAISGPEAGVTLATDVTIEVLKILLGVNTRAERLAQTLTQVAIFDTFNSFGSKYREASRVLTNIYQLRVELAIVQDQMTSLESQQNNSAQASGWSGNGNLGKIRAELGMLRLRINDLNAEIRQKEIALLAVLSPAEADQEKSISANLNPDTAIRFAETWNENTLNSIFENAIKPRNGKIPRNPKLAAAYKGVESAEVALDLLVREQIATLNVSSFFAFDTEPEGQFRPGPLFNQIGDRGTDVISGVRTSEQVHLRIPFGANLRAERDVATQNVEIALHRAQLVERELRAEIRSLFEGVKSKIERLRLLNEQLSLLSGQGAFNINAFPGQRVLSADNQLEQFKQRGEIRIEISKTQGEIAYSMEALKSLGAFNELLPYECSGQSLGIFPSTLEAFLFLDLAVTEIPPSEFSKNIREKAEKENSPEAETEELIKATLPGQIPPNIKISRAVSNNIGEKIGRIKVDGRRLVFLEADFLGEGDVLKIARVPYDFVFLFNPQNRAKAEYLKNRIKTMGLSNRIQVLSHSNYYSLVQSVLAGGSKFSEKAAALKKFLGNDLDASVLAYVGSGSKNAGKISKLLINHRFYFPEDFQDSGVKLIALEALISDPIFWTMSTRREALNAVDVVADILASMIQEANERTVFLSAA